MMTIPRATESDEGTLLQDVTAMNVWLSDAFGSTPWYSVALVQAMLMAGADVRFLSPEVMREPRYLARQGVVADPGPFSSSRVSRLPRPTGKAARLLVAMANSAALRWQLTHAPEKRPDVLHLQQLPALNHGVRDDFRTIACAQRFGVPVLHTVHNLLPHDSGERLRSVYQRLYSAVDHLICHSPDVAERLQKNFHIDASRMSVVPHGPLFEGAQSDSEERARSRCYLNISSERTVVLWQGILAPYKGLDVLLRAWEVCIQEWPAGTPLPLLLIAGTGPSSEVEAVKAAVEQNLKTMRAEIRYITTAELPFFYEASDLLVYPYRNITTSGALLTGLTYQKPILASDLSPFRQYLHHRKNALLVTPGDVSALADALKALMLEASGVPQPEPIFEALRAGAAQNAELYTGWDSIAQQTLGVYRKLLCAK